MTILADWAVLHKVYKTLCESNDIPFNAMDLGCTLHHACTEDQIKDMLGFISWCLNNDQEDMYILGNIGHDLQEFKHEYLNGKNGFSPRSFDHKKYIDLSIPQIAENLNSSIA